MDIIQVEEYATLACSHATNAGFLLIIVPPACKATSSFLLIDAS